MNLLSDKIIKIVCWTLLHSLWQGLLLALLTGLVMILSRKSSSAIRYYLLSGIFIFFLVITGFTFYTQWKQASGENDSLSSQNRIVPYSANAWPTIYDSHTYSGISLKQYTLKFLDYFDSHASLVVMIWFIVFMTKLVRILSGLVQIQRIRYYRTNTPEPFWKNRLGELAGRIGISREIRLLESAIMKMPMVVGFLKPTILVPIGMITNLSPAEVESILLHELAHIKRRDYFFNLLQCFVDVAFFFNPAILWISSLIRNERENCCDDIAIRESRNKKQFVQALVSFHQYNMDGMRYAMPFAGRKSSLINRVKRIVDNNNHALNQSEKAVLLIGLVVFGVAFTTIRQNKDASLTSPSLIVGRQHVMQKPQRAIDEKIIQLTTVKNSTKKAAVTFQKDHKMDTSISVPVVVTNRVDDIVNLKVANDLNLALLLDIKTAERSAVRDLEWEMKKSAKESGRDNHSSKEPGLEEFMQGLRELGYKNISVQQARRLQDHDVNTDFIISFREKGYGVISLEQALSLRDHDITIEFINSFSELGYKEIPLILATALKDHGVSVLFIRSMDELGYKNISLNQAIHLKDAGLSPEFVQSMAELGYSNIPLEQVVDLKNHGVSANFIRGFNQLEFKNISLEQATALRDHDVTPDFIVKMRKKTGSDFSLAEYITLRDQL